MRELQLLASGTQMISKFRKPVVKNWLLKYPALLIDSSEPDTKIIEPDTKFEKRLQIRFLQNLNSTTAFSPSWLYQVGYYTIPP